MQRGRAALLGATLLIGGATGAPGVTFAADASFAATMKAAKAEAVAFKRMLSDVAREGVWHGVGGETIGRRLYACEAPEPMVWKVTKGATTFYMLGTYQLKAEDVNSPLPPEIVQTVMDCTDIAYFELPCPATLTGGLGQYLAHCSFYPMSSKQDSIAMRLDTSTIASLQQAFENIAAKAAPGCEAAAQQIRQSIGKINSTDFRMALYPFYESAVRVLNPSACVAGGAGDQTYDDWVRSVVEENDRPTFGLEDVESQCNAIQGNSIAEDVDLAKYIISVYNNPTLMQKEAQSRGTLSDVIKCGDLASLSSMQHTFHSLPWLLQRVVADRNSAMVDGIHRAMSMHTDKTVLFALGALHFIDIEGASGIPALLQAAGFAVQRVAGGEVLQCSMSTHRESGAAQLGYCLAPPFQTQPASCLNFTSGFSQRLGDDPMQGRTRNESACVACSNSPSACDCEVEWHNTDVFEQLCAEPINGVSGQVLVMDLTRNPGSMHSSNALSEKTIRAITQECYATSCNTNLLEKMALKSWYSKYGDLAEGKVVLRPISGAGEVSMTVSDDRGGVFGDLDEPAWFMQWWAWALIVGLLACCLVAAFAWTLQRNSIKGGSTRSASVEEDDDEVTQPIQTYRPVYPDNGQGYLSQSPGGLKQQPPFPQPLSEQHPQLQLQQQQLLQQQQMQTMRSMSMPSQLMQAPGGPPTSVFHVPGLEPNMEQQNLDWRQQQQWIQQSALRGASGYGLVPQQVAQPQGLPGQVWSPSAQSQHLGSFAA